jgi:hypothetical protein
MCAETPVPHDFRQGTSGPEGTDMTLAQRNLGTPDQKRSFEHGDMQVVTLAGTTFVRAVLRPGWRWPADVKPGAGTGSCQVAHASYIVSGRFAVRMDDGTETESGPGDALVAGPGHDAWVVGGEPCEMIDVALAGAAAASTARRARPRRGARRRGW